MSTLSTIYLDYASTTPVDPRVASKMMDFLTPDGQFGNPASRSHRFGWKADSSPGYPCGRTASQQAQSQMPLTWTDAAETETHRDLCFG